MENVYIKLEREIDTLQRRVDLLEGALQCETTGDIAAQRARISALREAAEIADTFGHEFIIGTIGTVKVSAYAVAARIRERADELEREQS